MRHRSAGGQRLGLLLHRRNGGWEASLCDQYPADELRAAARPLPTPDGSGPVAFLVGGRFGPARVLALDARGRTLAYGRGKDGVRALAACPGGRRAVEIVVGDELPRILRLAVRGLAGMRVLREVSLPFAERRKPYLVPTAVSCADARASEVFVFATNNDGGWPVPTSRILRVRGEKVAVISTGSGSACSFGSGRAFVNEGRTAQNVVAINLRTGRERALARVPRMTGPLVPSPDGTKLAGVGSRAPGGRTAPTSLAVLVDLTTATPRVRTAPLGGSLTGEMAWVTDRQVAFLPSGGDEAVGRVFDPALREVSRFGAWRTSHSAVRGGTVLGIGWCTLFSARLPRGPSRVLGKLPSPEVSTIVAVPR